MTGYDGEVVDNGDGSYTITNSLNTTKITVIKVWNDDNNRDGLEPDSVQVQLKSNGENVGEAVTLNDEDDWSYSWSDLPIYTAGGQEITYSVEEVEVPDGYTMSGGTTLVPVTDTDGNPTGEYKVCGGGLHNHI